MILVTGGTGFIGSKLIKRLIEKDYHLVCTKRESSDYSRINDEYDLIEWIDTDYDSLANAFKNFQIEGIIHCATYYGRENGNIFSAMKTNVDFPLTLLELACKYKSRFFINTDTFFTRELKGSWTEDVNVYMNSYTKTKFIFRETVKENISQIGMPFLNLELQHVYGENDVSGKFVTNLLEQLKANVHSIELTAGIQERDWIHIDDVIEAYMVVLANINRFTNNSFNNIEIGTGIKTSLREFCLSLRELSGATTELIFGAREMQENEIMKSVADITELSKLGWVPKVSLREGMERLLN